MAQQLSDTKRGSTNEPPFFQNNPNKNLANDELEKCVEFRCALSQFLAVSGKNILLYVYGMTLGFQTIIIPAIEGGEDRDSSDIVLNKEEISWFSSINLIVVPLGCLFSGVLSQPIGKRRAMQLVNIPFLATWLLFYFATTKKHLYAAMCLSGLGGGLMEAPVLTYVAEITEPKYRGVLSALGSTTAILGIFIQFILGSLLNWRTIAALNSIFPVLSIIVLCFVPESPTWLIRERRFREAVKALQWLRGWVSEREVEAEFNRLYENLITQPALEESLENAGAKPSKCVRWFRMFRKRSFLVPFLLISYIFFTGHFSGKTSLQTYAVQIFYTLKVPINKYLATILLGASEIVSTIIGVILIHFTGKRPLVLVSIIGVGMCFFGTTTYAHYLKVVPDSTQNHIHLNDSFLVPREGISSLRAEEKTFFLTTDLIGVERLEHNMKKETLYAVLNDTQPEELYSPTVPDSKHSRLVWLPLVLLLGAAFFAHLGIRMVPWILIGECFPPAIRGTSSGLVGGLGYIFGFLANKLFLQMLGALTLPGTFWFYACVAFIGAVILYFALPETEGYTLAEIEAHFSKKSDTNLLSKKWRNNRDNIPMQLKNSQDLRMPASIDPYIETRA